MKNLVFVLAFFCLVGCQSTPEPQVGVDPNPPTEQDNQDYASMSQNSYNAQLWGCVLVYAMGSKMIPADMEKIQPDEAMKAWNMAYSALKHMQRMAKARGDAETYEWTIEREKEFIPERTAIKDGTYLEKYFGKTSD